MHPPTARRDDPDMQLLASTDLGLWRPVLVLAILQAGLYGLLPISLVLCYRVSRTIAFVHGGIASAAASIRARPADRDSRSA